VVHNGWSLRAQSAQINSPTPGPDTDRVNGGPRPVDLAVVAQPVQQPMMQGFPYPSGLPVAQPPLAGHAAATAKLLGWEQPPGHPGPQHIDDPPSTARPSIQGRLPLGCGRLCGSSGWMADQTSSGTSCSAIVRVIEELAMARDHPAPHQAL
jgi:hypothetical protein